MNLTASRAPGRLAKDSVFTERPAVQRLGPSKRIPYGRLIGVVLVLGLWSAGSALHVISANALAAPWTVANSGWNLLVHGALLPNLGDSLGRAAIGLGIGTVVGVTLAIVSGLWRVGEYVLDGPIQVQRAIPFLGLIPLLILWIGIGQTFRIVLIALGVAIHMYMQVHNSLTAIDKRFVELAEVQRVSRATFIRQVVIPGSLPGFFLGLRLSATGAWLSLVVVETVNSTNGLGFMMTQAETYGESNVILVCLAVYGIFGFASDAGFRLLQRKALSWQRTLAS
jgi:sulfonate transport system permease protein